MSARAFFRAILDSLGDIRFRKFRIMNIDDSSALLSEYLGRARRVTVPARLDEYRIHTLGNALFENNDRVRSVRIRPGVRVIRGGAFEDCIHLRRISVPETVRTIEGQPFAGCRSLKTIRVAGGNPRIRMENGMLIDASGGRLVICLDRRSESVTVPEDVRVISSYAFSRCPRLKTINLPEGLEVIESSAFDGCGVESLRIPERTETFGRFAFSFIGGLRQVTAARGSEAEKYCLEKGWTVLHADPSRKETVLIRKP